MDRIDMLYSHSYSDDYFYLDEIVVRMKDAKEQKRIEKKLEKLQLPGSLEFPDKRFIQKIANELEVNHKIIHIDTEEIDLM